MGVHVPVVFPHAWQMPLHSALQHVLSTQCMFRHCAFVVHPVPFGSRQAPFMHVAPGMQSVDVVHRVGQLAAPLQTKGAHSGMPT
jgi:hypothetical protein